MDSISGNIGATPQPGELNPPSEVTAGKADPAGASTGGVVVNGQSYSVFTAVKIVCLEAIGKVDDQLATDLNKMSDRIDEMDKLSQFYSECQRLKSSGCATDDDITINGVTKSATSWAKELGIGSPPWTTTISASKHATTEEGKGVSYYNDVWESNLSTVETKLDSLNNDSQLANIELQSLMDERSNFYLLATQMLGSGSDVDEKVTANI